MPTRDIRSDILQQLAFNGSITTNTTTNGVAIDTADYDLGVMFGFCSPVYTDGTYTPVLEQSDNSDMSGASDIPDSQLIGTEANAVISALTQPGESLKTIGLIGTKRYIRVKIVSTSVTTGARITIFASKKGEVLPVV